MKPTSSQFFLRDIPPIGAAFRSAETYGNLGEAIAVIPHASAVNVSGLALALLVALASHIVQLHDRVSDVLGIRRRFDVNKILVPLAMLVGLKLTPDQIRIVRSKRDSLMREVFYRYASSGAENPLVDKHDIQHALAAWSWFLCPQRRLRVPLGHTRMFKTIVSVPERGVFKTDSDVKV